MSIADRIIFGCVLVVGSSAMGAQNASAILKDAALREKMEKALPAMPTRNA